jgi:hypothetical protein
MGAHWRPTKGPSIAFMRNLLTILSLSWWGMECQKCVLGCLYGRTQHANKSFRICLVQFAFLFSELCGARYKLYPFCLLLKIDWLSLAYTNKIANRNIQKWTKPVGLITAIKEPSEIITHNVRVQWLPSYFGRSRFKILENVPAILTKTSCGETLYWALTVLYIHHALLVNWIHTWSTYLLTYSMEQSPSWEAKTSWATQEIPRILWTRRFITAFTRARHLSLSWAR